jgi:hypothetical protein
VSTQPTFVLDLEEAMTVWMDGFLTGAATTLKTVYIGIPDDAIDHQADRMADQMRRDPIAMAEVEQCVLERVTGTDSGPSNLTVQSRPPTPADVTDALVAFGESLGSCGEIIRLLKTRFPNDRHVTREVEKYEKRRVRALRLIPRVNDLLDALPFTQATNQESE